MTTGKEFKDLGVEFVVGDEYNSSEVFVEIIPEGRSFSGQLKTDCGVYSDTELHGLVPSIFAWRPLKTLPDNPKFKYEKSEFDSFWRPLLDQSVDLVKECSIVKKLSNIGNVLHNLSCSMASEREQEEFGEYALICWDAASKLPNEPEGVVCDKPVFTQEMADRGELPPVGSKAMVSWFDDTDKEYYECEMVFFIDKVGVVISDGVYYAFDSCNNSCNKATFKELDTRTPKQKAVDEMVMTAIESEDDIAKSIIYEACVKLINAGYEKKC